MKLLLILLFLVVACRKSDSIIVFDSQNANSFDSIVETAKPLHTAINTPIGLGVRSGYWETLPTLYSKTTKRYPLIVFNHGIGENGSSGKSLAGVNCCGLPYHAKNGTFPANFGGTSFIVVSPQYYNRPTGAQVQDVVQYAINKYRVDPNRIYVVGMSQGGGVTMDWAMLYGEKAAAIFPACPGTTPTDSRAQQIAAKNLPIWWTYGTADNLVPPSQGTQWENLIDKYNPNYAQQTKLTIWQGLSHNGTWGKAFNPVTKVDGKNAYEWLLTYKRDNNIPPIARAGDDRSIPVNWGYMPTVNGTTSTDQDGWIAKFNWSQVSGAAASIVSPNTGQTKITGLTFGVYTFRLTVTDNKGAQSSDDITITMN